MSLDRLKRILENRGKNEATLSQTLQNFDINKFTEYYLTNLKDEYGGEIPEGLLDYLFEEIENIDYLYTYFEQEFGFPPDDYNHSKHKDKFYRSRILRMVLKDYIENALDNIDIDIKNVSANHKLRLYRVLDYDIPHYLYTNKNKRRMTVNPEDTYLQHLQKYGGRLGIYWTSDKDSVWILADSIREGEGDFENGVSHLIEVEVENKYINWYDTLYQRTHPEYGDWQEWKPEKEIRLFKNTPLKITSLSVYISENEEGKYVGDFIPIDITPIKNKIFYA